jgi:hypothetical protein
MRVPADPLSSAHIPADGRPARGESRVASVIPTRPEPGPTGSGRATVEGSLLFRVRPQPLMDLRGNPWWHDSRAPSQGERAAPSA